MTKFNRIREKTRLKVGKLGYNFNPNLPVLDDFEISREPNEITGRFLVLHACVAWSYGLNKKKALFWIDQMQLVPYVSSIEENFLLEKINHISSKFRWHVEALWSLTWAAGYHDGLDFGKPCSDDFVTLFPDIKQNSPIKTFISKIHLRSKVEIAEAIDLSYCLDWAVKEARLRGQSHNANNNSKLQEQVITERRRGLEWLTSRTTWEDVPLDS